MKRKIELYKPFAWFDAFREAFENPYLEEQRVTGRDLILNGDDGVREGEDASGDVLGLLPHQLFLLLVLLQQGSESSSLFLLQKLLQLLKLLLDLLLCGLSLALAPTEGREHM